MPIYEFRCAVCGCRFSLLLPMRESNTEQACPQCHAAGARRLISSFAAPGAAGGEADCGPAG